MPTPFYPFVVLLQLADHVRVSYRLDVRRVENLPRDGGFVLAANHTSNFDPWPLGVPLGARRQLLLHGQVGAVQPGGLGPPLRRGRRPSRSGAASGTSRRSRPRSASARRAASSRCSRRARGARRDCARSSRRGRTRVRRESRSRPVSRSSRRRSRAPTALRASEAQRSPTAPPIQAGRPRRASIPRDAAQNGNRAADGGDRRLYERRRCEARPLLAVDGDSFAHRAYHGLPKTIRRAGGRPAGAVVGFANFLAPALGEPNGLARCSSAGTRWRRRRTGTRRSRLPGGRECSTPTCSSSSTCCRSSSTPLGFASARRPRATRPTTSSRRRGRRGGARRTRASSRRPTATPSSSPSERTTILQPVRGRDRGRADRAGGGARALRRRAGAGARLHRAARRPTRTRLPGRARSRAEDGGRSLLRQYGVARGRARRPAGFRREADDAAALPSNRHDRRLRAAPARSPTRRNLRRRPPRLRPRARARPRSPDRLARRLGEPVELVATSAFARLHPTGHHPETPARLEALLGSTSRLDRGGARGERRGTSAATTASYVASCVGLHEPTWLDGDTIALRDELRGGAARGRRGDRGGRARRLRARAAARAPRAGGPGDGLLPVQQRRDRRALRAGRAGRRAASRSSTGTSTTATARRRSSGTTRRSSSSRSTSGRSIRAPAGRTSRTTRR